MSRRNEGQKSTATWEVCQANPLWQLQFKGKLFIYLKWAPSVNKKQFHDMTMNNNWSWTTVLWKRKTCWEKLEWKKKKHLWPEFGENIKWVKNATRLELWTCIVWRCEYLLFFYGDRFHCLVFSCPKDTNGVAHDYAPKQWISMFSVTEFIYSLG